MYAHNMYMHKLFLSTVVSGCDQHGHERYHLLWRCVSQAVAFLCYGGLRAVGSAFPSRCMGGKSGLLCLAGL